MGKWVVEKVVGTWDKGKDVENDEKYVGMCEKCCGVGRGNIELCVAILQRVAQGCTPSPNVFKVYINDMVVVVEQQRRKSGWGKIWRRD